MTTLNHVFQVRKNLNIHVHSKSTGNDLLEHLLNNLVILFELKKENTFKMGDRSYTFRLYFSNETERFYIINEDHIQLYSNGKPFILKALEQQEVLLFFRKQRLMLYFSKKEEKARDVTASVTFTPLSTQPNRYYFTPKGPNRDLEDDLLHHRSLNLVKLPSITGGTYFNFNDGRVYCIRSLHFSKYAQGNEIIVRRRMILPEDYPYVEKIIHTHKETMQDIEFSLEDIAFDHAAVDFPIDYYLEILEHCNEHHFLPKVKHIIPLHQSVDDYLMEQGVRKQELEAYKTLTKGMICFLPPIGWAVLDFNLIANTTSVVTINTNGDV